MDTVKRRIRKGIPESMRATVWPLLLGMDQLKHDRGLDYRTLVNKELKKEDEVQIRKDIGRTFPENYLFTSEEG